MGRAALNENKEYLITVPVKQKKQQPISAAALPLTWGDGLVANARYAVSQLLHTN